MAERDAISPPAGLPAGSAGAIDRRDFLNEVAMIALGIASVGAVVETLGYLSPNVLFEPPSSFRIGEPGDYPVNSVTYMAEQQVYILRTPGGIFAQSATCTHLGCVTQWDSEQRRISCPCHGSKFSEEGTVLQGPAPRPLPHFEVRLMPDGGLLVDKLIVVPQTQILKV